jgi:hypothetical protein
MTITLSTDPIVATASTARFLASSYITTRREVRANKKYERKIKKSQKKLAETKLVPGYTRIYA